MRKKINPAIFRAFWREQKSPVPEPEFRFAPPRLWRFDWAWPVYAIALEIEGGIWRQGRHNRGSGFLGDIEKYNAAASMGWLVFRCVHVGVGQPSPYDPRLVSDIRAAMLSRGLQVPGKVVS